MLVAKYPETKTARELVRKRLAAADLSDVEHVHGQLELLDGNKDYSEQIKAPRQPKALKLRRGQG